MTGTPGHILLSIGGGDVVVRDLALQGLPRMGAVAWRFKDGQRSESKLINVRITNNIITCAGARLRSGVSHRRRDGDNASSITGNPRRRRLVRPAAVASTSPARPPGCWWRTHHSRMNSVVSSLASFGGGS